MLLPRAGAAPRPQRRKVQGEVPGLGPTALSQLPRGEGLHRAPAPPHTRPQPSSCTAGPSLPAAEGGTAVLPASGGSAAGRARSTPLPARAGGAGRGGPAPPYNSPLAGGAGGSGSSGAGWRRQRWGSPLR